MKLITVNLGTVWGVAWYKSAGKWHPYPIHAELTTRLTL